MTTTFLILCGCALVAIPLLLFLLIVQPVWAFIEVCGATLFSRGRKIVWLVLLLIFFIVGSIPYALFVSASAALRRVTFLCILFIGLVVGVGYGAIKQNPELRDQISSYAQNVIQEYDKTQELSKLLEHLPW